MPQKDNNLMYIYNDWNWLINVDHYIYNSTFNLDTISSYVFQVGTIQSP